MPKTYSFKLDDRGRIILPRELREQFRMEPGDVLYAQPDQQGFRVLKSENPFDALAEQAIKEGKEGRTVPLEDVIRRFSDDESN